MNTQGEKPVPLPAERLRQIVDAYGAKPARWPLAERDAALRAMQADAGAGGWLQEAEALDRELDAWTLPEPDAALRRIVVGGIPKPQPKGWRDWLAQLSEEIGGWRIAVPTFAASLLIGLLLPMQVEQLRADAGDEDFLAMVLPADESPEWLP